MKKLFTLFNICIIAGILFASCGTRFSIKKRHYSGGYYFSSGSIKSDNSSEQNENNSSVDGSKDYSTKLNEKSNEDDFSITAKSVLNVEKSDVSEIRGETDAGLNPVASVLTVENETASTQFKLKNEKLEKRFHKSMKSTSEGLSLFWIVILIILILWAVGFFGGSVGALINLLLLVALILLILWLLRVI